MEILCLRVHEGEGDAPCYGVVEARECILREGEAASLKASFVTDEGRKFVPCAPNVLMAKGRKRTVRCYRKNLRCAVSLAETSQYRFSYCNMIMGNRSIQKDIAACLI